MSVEKRLQIKVVNAIGDLIKATKTLQDVSIEVAAECEPGDKGAADLVTLVGQIASGILPMEVLHKQLENKLSE